MFDFFDEDLDNMELVEGALSLNLAIKSSTSKQWAEDKLELMLIDAEAGVASEIEPKAQFAKLLKLFYQEWGFVGDYDEYFSSENAFIDKVLERKKGIPVSLGSILLYLAQNLNFPVSGVSFPTQFLLRIDWPNERPLYLNPFNGEYVSKQVLGAWLIGHDGPLAKLKEKDLAAVDNPTVIGRLLALMKHAFLREETYELALKCSDLALSFTPDDPYEIRDRGFIYQQLDCNQMASSDFEFFIENCPDDPAADLLKAQVRLLKELPLTLH
jgi:regulator of sirC expression with transglutaminase-like and TPR domain